MKKYIHILLSVVLILYLCACAHVSNDAAQETENHIVETEAADLEVSQPTVESVPDVTGDHTTPTQPLHSELYLPDYTTEQIIEYFEEVVLNVEYTDGTGADDLVKKWLSPIYCQIYGDPTDADKEVLSAFFEQLNVIPGFPGIYLSTDPFQVNVTINFLDAEDFSISYSDVVCGEDAYGAAQFWYYTATNELHTAHIGCRTDIDQITRNSIIQEEIINILGLSDTTLRPDSITYQYSDENTALSDVDLVILKILYNPSIQCGDNYDHCSAIIQELYY